jgi:ribosomal protein L24
VILEGLNLFVRHKRAQAPGQESTKTRIEKAMHISNVMYYVEKLKRPVRLVKSVTADGKRVRGYKDPTTKNFVQLEA